MSVRRPAVAGMFYEADEAGLRREVESCFLGNGGPGRLPAVNPEGSREIVGLVSPHAGLIYSGAVAAWAYSRMAEDGVPDTAVLIGPNHRSPYPSVALSDDKAWQTPLGRVELDADITARIADSYPEASMKPEAHYAEHSLEVQLPFLQYIAGLAAADIRIIPMLIGAYPLTNAADEEMKQMHRLGDAIADALRGRNAVVIASTDFTHYETGETALSKDSRAIASILALDDEGLMRTVDGLDISMCGARPTAVAIAAAKGLGAVSAHELAYRNSGDVTGDYSEVVGYAAIELRRQAGDLK